MIKHRVSEPCAQNTKVLEIELGRVQERIWMAPGTRKFEFDYSESAKEFLLEQNSRRIQYP